jgi:hypothetical protein
MAHYSPELLAAMRHAYENTDKPLPRVAADFKIGITTLQWLRDKEGWSKRSERVRDCPRGAQLLEAAKALGAAQVNDATHHDRHPEALGQRPSLEGCTPQHQGPPSFEAHSLRSLAPQDDGDALAQADPNSALSPIDRLEALVVKEIAAEEAVRARLQREPRRRAHAERCARTLSILAQTLRSLQQQRCGRSTDDETIHDDDMPADIDEFRRALARRIDAFVASRADAGDAGESGGAAPLGEV